MFKLKVFEIFGFGLPPRCIDENRPFRGEQIKVVGMVWECFGDVLASKTINNNNLDIENTLKIICFIEISIFTYVYIKIP